MNCESELKENKKTNELCQHQDQSQERMLMQPVKGATQKVVGIRVVLEGPKKRSWQKRMEPKRVTVARRTPVLRPLSSDRVMQILEQAYHRVESDDRHMYRMNTHIVRKASELTSTNVTQQLTAVEFKKTLTYGEVTVESVSMDLLPLLDLQPHDVFYDLGCGSGKIVVQVALQSSCEKAKGIEILQGRVDEGMEALRQIRKTPEQKRVQKVCIVQGDICDPPPGADIEDATVIFINNVCFGAHLMNMIQDSLLKSKAIRRMVTLRKICDRHSHVRCAKRFCSQYQHPPTEKRVSVTWAKETTAFLYIKKDN